jgi:hypothetical protein
MRKIELKIKDLKEQLKNAEDQQKKQRSNRMFKCLCGEMHKIKDCVVVQSHWYTPPSGCAGGDHWNSGELIILCENNRGLGNRILFNEHSSYHKINGKTPKRLSDQFSWLYKYLFKEVIDQHREKVYQRWQNNFYFDMRQEFFELDQNATEYKH